MRRPRPPPTPRHALDVGRGLLWAWRSASDARTHLRVEGGVSAPVRPPPTLPVRSLRGVRWGLRLRHASCLERSLVLQRWFLAHGQEREVVVGVAVDGTTTLAHAWLAGEEHLNDREYTEMTRVPAP